MDLLTDRPRDPDLVVVRRPAGAVTWGQIEIQARELAARLRAQALTRVALGGASPELIMAVLLACQQAGCELLLLRSQVPLEDPAWREWRVAGVVDAGFRLTVLSAPAASGAAGFAILLTTSGTTGKPKVARHSIDALLGRIRFHASRGARPRWLLTYHPSSFAGLQVLLTVLVSGAELIAVDRPNVPELARAALEHRPTHVSATPTFWRAFLVALGESASVLPLDQITLGGEIVDQATLERLRALFPKAGITHIYASTEAGALFAVRDGVAGFPAPWLEEGVDGARLRIRGGELQVQSPRAMLGYESGAKASPVLADGWLSTGDLVEQRGDRVYFLGRGDSVISVGGAKLTPEEVEAVLLQVPGVAEGRVFGVKNPITGYLVGAEIVADPGADVERLRADLIAAARTQLEPYKVPRVIRFVASIRVSEAGKKDRSA
jgi:acyl-CoA synthetase (AMP-forming)/AMP-acid ligase II